MEVKEEEKKENIPVEKSEIYQSQLEEILESVGYAPGQQAADQLTIGELMDMLEAGALKDIVISGDHGGPIPAE